MTAMLAMNQPMPFVESEPKEDLSYLRKKCKSCKQFSKHGCPIKAYRRPLDQACENYTNK